jgi:hypothetical protein
LQEGVVLWAGHLREVRLEDRTGLRVQSGTGHHACGRHNHLRPGRGLRRRATHRRFSHSPRRPRCLSGRLGILLACLGAALASGVWGCGGSHSQGQLPQSVAADSSIVGVGKAPDHRGGYKPAQGSILPGAPQGEDPQRASGAFGVEDHRLHLRAVFFNVQLGRPLRRLADLLV